MSELPQERRRRPRRPVGVGVVGPTTEALRSLFHDLRQPVSTIAIMTEAILSTADLPPEVVRMLTHIRGETAYLHGLVDLAAGEAPAAGRTDVLAVIGQVINALAACPGQVLVRAEASPLLVRGTASGVRRALANVCDNALRAAGPHGQVRITAQQRGSNVIVDVEDDGPGYAVGAAGHTNIGLGTVRRVLAALDGHLDLGTSSLGGARARLTFVAAGDRPKTWDGGGTAPGSFGAGRAV